jgi:hypothetical protein
MGGTFGVTTDEQGTFRFNVVASTGQIPPSRRATDPTARLSPASTR